MIQCFTGVPGSGKSAHLSREMLALLERGTYVLANFDYDAQPWADHFIRIPDYPVMDEILEIVRKLPRNRKEGNVALCIDECSTVFDSRTWNQRGRSDWVTFMKLSRHIGVNVILVAQSAGMIDKQIRACIQTEVKHMKVAAMGSIPFILSGFGLLPLTFWVETYFGTRIKVATGFFLPRKKYWERYDSYDESFFAEGAAQS